MPLNSSVDRVQQALAARGLTCRVVEVPASTRTAVEAASVIGCEVAQIAKSIVFRGVTSGRPVIVIASGSNRVDEESVANAAGEPIARAEAKWVKETVGYVIGGVPPLGHLGQPRIFFDPDLLQFDTVWAAAGTPHTVFEIAPADLLTSSQGEILAR